MIIEGAKPMHTADLDAGHDGPLVCASLDGDDLGGAPPVYKTDTAGDLGRLLNRQVIDVCGVPRVMLSDQARSEVDIDGVSGDRGQHLVQELTWTMYMMREFEI
jgi:hypothetical protein